MTLQQRMEEKIACFKDFFEELPAVVIIHYGSSQQVAYMSQRGLNILGVTLEQLLEAAADYDNTFFKPEESGEYYPKLFEKLYAFGDDEQLTYFQHVWSAKEVRWKLYLTASKVFMRNDEGAAALILTTSTPVDEKHTMYSRVERLLEENAFLRSNKDLFASLTRREKEIIKLIAIGKNSTEIAAEFNLSEETIKTHRRNIKRKLNAESNYDIVRFAQAFDLL